MRIESREFSHRTHRLQAHLTQAYWLFIALIERLVTPKRFANFTIVG